MPLVLFLEQVLGYLPSVAAGAAAVLTFFALKQPIIKSLEQIGQLIGSAKKTELEKVRDEALFELKYLAYSTISLDVATERTKALNELIAACNAKIAELQAETTKPYVPPKTATPPATAIPVTGPQPGMVYFQGRWVWPESLSFDQLGELAARTPAPAAGVAPAPVTTTIPAPVTIPAPQVNVTVPTPTVNTMIDTSAIASAIPLIGTTLVTALASFAPGIGHGLSQGRNTCFGSTGEAILGSILKAGAPLALAISLDKFGPFRSALDNLAEKAWKEILGDPALKSPVTPDRAPEVSRALFMKALEAGMTAHLISAVAESSTPLKNMGLNYVAAFIGDMAGFAKIGGAMMSALESQALVLPFRYHINEQVRSLLPNIPQAQQLLAQRQITPRQFETLMAYNGMAPEYVNGFRELAFRPAAPRMLQQIGDAGIYDADYFRQELHAGEYDDATVEQMLRMLFARAQGDLKTLYVGTAIKRYKEGLDTPQQLETNLVTLGVSQSLLPKYVYGADLERDYDDMMDYVATLKAAVTKGAIDPPDMEQLLIKQGMSDSKAKLYSERAAIGLLPARPKP
jgi:hypothetical protein